MGVQARTDIQIRELLLSGEPKKIDSATFAQSSSATAGSVTDTTTYPVATQATKTEKVTVDSGTEQTVTFTTAINVGTVTSSNAFPVSTQDTLTEKVTIDGGSEQTVTFSGAITTAAQAAAQMDAQLTGCKVAVVGDNIVITSDTQGASSSVAIGTGTTDITWATPVVVNTAAGVAAEINAQLTGCKAAVVGGQVKITSDTTGILSTIEIGTGTATLTWAAASDGSGGVDVDEYTVCSQDPATELWYPLTDATATDGTEIPKGILVGGSITGAALAADDVDGQTLIVGGPITVDEDVVVFQNDLDYDTEVTNQNQTIGALLRVIGIFHETVSYISQQENS